MNRTVLALGITALLAAGCGDDDVEDAGLTTTTNTPTTTTTETPPETTTTEQPGAAIEDAAGTAEAWIAAVAAGDYDTVAALTSSRSLAAFGGREGIEEERTALAEGWGAWEHAEDLEVSTLPPIADGVVVVLLHGEVPQEGPPEEAWAAIPVVATDDGDRVEPFLQLGEPEVDPPPFTEISATPRFTVTAPAGMQVQAVVDDDHPASVSQVEDADGDRVDVTVDQPLALGLHVLTVVLRDGADVMVRTFEYPVAG